jgi:chromate reductase
MLLEFDMVRFNIAVVVGSVRKQSINRRLADALTKLADPDFAFHRLKIDDLPLYNQDLDHETPPESVARLRREVRAADGFLFVTPEYNRTITPLLANALHWASRPYGQNSWAGKPAAMAGASPGPIGTAAAGGHLRDLLSVLDMRLIVQPEAYVQFKDGLLDDAGEFADEQVRALYKGKIDKFTDWVELVAGAEKRAETKAA